MAGSETAAERPTLGRAPISEENRRRWESERLRPHAFHSDGAVCRCAVRWRVQTLARGLNRPEYWGEEPDSADQ